MTFIETLRVIMGNWQSVLAINMASQTNTLKSALPYIYNETREIWYTYGISPSFWNRDTCHTF
ncbi:hypothetical protein BH18THE2_BH18THE2_26990 [soil metagenome]